MLNLTQEHILRKLRNADGLDFSVLVKLALLDPAKDFRNADLRGVDFGMSVLSGFDFSGADLRFAKFDRASTDGAIFENSNTQGVIWPTLSAKRRSREQQTSNEMHPAQKEALDRILGELRRKQPRGLVSVPTGFGKSAIVERLLEKLDEGHRYRRVVLVLESAAERDQFKQRLRDIPLSHITVEQLIVPRNPGLSRNVGRSSQSGLDWLEQSDLVICIAAPSRLLTFSREIEKLGKSVALIALTNLPIGKSNRRIEQQIRQLEDHFRGFLFVFDIEEALRQNILYEVKVETKRLEFAANEALVSKGVRKVADELVADLAFQVGERFPLVQCLLICRSIEDVELVASGLADRLNRFGTKRVLAVTSRSAQREFWDAIEGQNAVIVMTAAMAVGSPLRTVWNSGLIAVLTEIDFPLTDRLRFRTAQSDRLSAVILDYSGSFGQVWGDLLSPLEVKDL